MLLTMMCVLVCSSGGMVKRLYGQEVVRSSGGTVKWWCGQKVRMTEL